MRRHLVKGSVGVGVGVVAGVEQHLTPDRMAWVGGVMNRA